MNSHIFTNKNGNILMREFERVLDFIINKDKLYNSLKKNNDMEYGIGEVKNEFTYIHQQER